MTAPITYLKLITGDNKHIEPPSGFLKIPVDLNRGQKQDYIGVETLHNLGVEARV